MSPRKLRMIAGVLAGGGRRLATNKGKTPMILKKKKVIVVMALIAICAALGVLPEERANAQGLLAGKSIHVGLCSIATCPMPPMPVVKALDPASVVSPGGKVVLQGVNFNSPDGNPGQIVLKIGSKSPMLIRLGDNGYRQPYVARQLTVLGWAHGHVFGQIPADISGVMDGPARFEVWRADGSKSDPLIVHFTATLDLTILPMGDVALQSCSTNGDTNLCNHWSDSTQLSIPPNVSPSPSLYSSHVLFIPLQQGHLVTGLDVFNFSLKNGWTLDDSYQFENGDYRTTGCNGDFDAEDLTGSKTMGAVKFDWALVCSLQYHASLHITGPKGVPWK